MPPQSDKLNGKGKPAQSRAAAQTVPEGATEAEDTSGLDGVPFLGPTRRRALVEHGIRTVDDLRAASVLEIAGVKGVGLGNAQRIKDWLSAQAPAFAEMPPPPPEIDVPPVRSPDPSLAQDNAVIFDGLGEIDALVASLRTGMKDTGVSKKLDRQFEKATSLASELAEAPDTLTPQRLGRAVKLLERLVAVLQDAAGRKHLSEKRQEALAEQLRDQRKALQKVLGE